MQPTSETWKSLASMSGVRVESKAIVDNVEYTNIEPPVITRSLMQNGLEVGNVVSAVCQFELDTNANISKSAEVQIMARLVGYDDDDTPIYSEWLPQGTFSVSRRVNDPRIGVQYFECYDALLKTNAVWEPASSTWPQETSSILSEIRENIGLQLDARTSIVSYLMNEPVFGTTMRDILGIIAQQNGGNWIVTPENKLRLVKIVDLNESESADTIVDVGAIVDEYYTGEIKTISGVKFSVEDAGDVIIGDDTGAVVSLTISGLIAADVAELLIGKTYRPFTYANAYFDIAAELGDYVQSDDAISVIYSETVTLGTGMHGDISAPDLAEIDDEYPYVGSSGKTLIEAKAYAQIVSDAARDAAIAAAAAQLAAAVVNINSDIEDLQSQIDGNITTWFYAVDPTLNNPPANAWTTEADKNNHLGDLYYNTESGYCWRFMLENSQYRWQRISDADVTAALATAQHAQDTADGKRRVFIAQPTPPYDAGDLWTEGETGDIFVCTNGRASGTYVSTDWENASKYTDDTVANNAIAIANAAIKKVDVEYAENQSTTTAPTSGWQTTAPAWRAGYYIWQRTKTTTSTGSSYSTPTCISGRDGVDGQTGPQGQTGIGVSDVVEQYYLSTSNTTQTGGSWSTAQPQWVSGKYIWTRSQVTWTNSTTTYTTPVLAQAINGANSTASAASAAVTALDNALNQQEVFNRLTNNGAAQGVLLNNGQLYVNASYINTGYLSATRIQGGTLTLGGLNEERGDMYILDESGNTVARIYSVGIAFADTESLHGVKISSGGSVELSQISVYGFGKQLKATIAPLSTAGISIKNGTDVIATFGSGSSSIKSTFSVEDGSGGRLSVTGGHISLTDSYGSKLWMPGNGEIEAQANLVVTRDITVQQQYDAVVTTKNSGTKAAIQLGSWPSGNQGLWSLGYYNGSGYVASGKWLIHRNTADNVVINGTASGNVEMYGNLNVQSSNSAVVMVKDTDRGHALSLGSWHDGTQGLYSWGYYDGSSYVASEKWLIYRNTSGDVVTGNLNVLTANSPVITVNDTDRRHPIQLGSWHNGTQGLWSLGYYNGSRYVENGKWLIYRDTTGDVVTEGLNVQTANSGVITVKDTDLGHSLQLGSWHDGTQGLWSLGYYNGSSYVATGKWLIYRNTSGDIIIPGNANTRANLGTYLYLNDATPATVYARLNALNNNETVNIAMSQAVTNYLTGAKVNIYLTGQVRKGSATEYRFMAYRSDGKKMYIWQADVTANGVSNVSCCEYSGTSI